MLEDLSRRKICLVAGVTISAVPLAMLAWKFYMEREDWSGWFHQQLHAAECLISTTEPKVSERDARRTRPVSFRFAQTIASFSTWYGHYLRRLLYEQMTNTVALSRADLIRAGQGYSFDGSGIDRFVVPLPLPTRMYDRFVALWIHEIAVENQMHDCAQAARDVVLRFYPQVYWNAPPADAYHVTVFHFSQYEEFFPLPNGGPEWEMTQSQNVWRQFPKFTIVAHDVILTNTGTVLVLWHTKVGNVDSLRYSFKQNFPVTPMGQTERIMHSTLVRFVLPDHNSESLIALSSQEQEDFQKEMMAIKNKIVGTEVEIQNLLYSGCKMYYDCSRFRYGIPRWEAVYQVM